MITVQGMVAITTITQRERTTVVTDDGALAPALTLTGLISRRSHSTLALARVAERQIHELAHWSRVAGGVHVASTEFPGDDGLYELRNVQTRTTPVTGVSIGIVVSMTLVRIAGTGPGSNGVRRALPQSTLIANGFAITSTPRYVIPVGASGLTSPGGIAFVGSADGNAAMIATGVASEYALDAADHNHGEVKVWDTGGSATPSTWTRVYGPDHVFATSDHCAIDNGRVRLTPMVAAPGRHTIEVWDGAAWSTVTGAVGDYASVNFAGFVSWGPCRIIDITPWRAEVEWRPGRGTTPYFVVKTYVLERGKAVARLTLTADTATGMWSGITGVGRYTFVQQLLATGTARIKDHSIAAEAVQFDFGTGDVTQPYLATIEPGGTVMALVIGTTLTNHQWLKDAPGAVLYANVAVTSYTAWLGGIPYSQAKAIFREAELGGLSGTAAITTVAGASGGASNNAVTLPALNDYVESFGMGSPPVGSTQILFARVQNSGTSASDSVTIGIRNSTAGTFVTGSSQVFTAAALGTAGTWKWISSIGTGWNGTDVIFPRVTRSASGGGGAIYVDEFVLVTVSDAVAGFAQEVARAALTAVRVRTQTIRQVR